MKESIKQIYQGLGQKVTRMERKEGYENVIFVVSTNKGKSVIRIPKDGMEYSAAREYWVCTVCKNKVRVPEVILYDKSKKLIDSPFLIVSYIPGEDLKDAKLNRVQRQQLLTHMAQDLKRMHSVKTKGFGFLAAKNKGEHITWREAVEPELLLTLKRLKHVLPPATLRSIRTYFRKHNAILDQKESRLLHNDLSRTNAHVHKGEYSGMLDFGGAFCGDPMYDLARAYQGLYPFGQMYDFLAGYGEIDRSRFNFYLLYHAAWSLYFFHKAGHKDWISDLQDMISMVLGS